MVVLFSQENAYRKPENSGHPEIHEEGSWGTLKGFNFSDLGIILNMIYRLCFRTILKKVLLQIAQL